MTAALGYAGLLAVSGLLTWWGSDRLERASTGLADRYGLPELVRGTLLVAVGSSFPELATAVGATLVHGEFELGMASVVGSAVFNVLVIPGLAVLASGPLSAELRLVYRDALFYLTAVVVIVLTFAFGLIRNPVPGTDFVGDVTRSLALIPLLLYVLYLFLQQQDTREHGERGPEGGEEVEGGRESDATDTDYRGAEVPVEAGSSDAGWMVLLAGLVAVVLGVEGLLRTAIWLGDVLGTPSFLWGATVIAATTSLPDGILSLREASAGRGSVSLGNVLGSNVFDLLVAIPAGILVAGTVPVDLAVVVPLMAALTGATLLLFTTMRTDLAVTRGEAWVLLAGYLVFLLVLGLETAGVVTWIG